MFKEIHFPKIPSTHLFAIEHIQEHKGSFVFISAKEQSQGVGRKGDPWIAKGNNLLGTFIFPLPPKDTSNLAQLLAYSTIKVLEKYALEPLFKWPNDILLSYKKVAGIMAEVKETTAIVSIGLNVNMTKSDLDTINIPATSLSEELRHPLPLLDLKQELLNHFFQDLQLFQTEGFTPFFQAFANKLAFLGKFAKADSLYGKIEGLHHDGRLIFQSEGRPILLSDNTLEIIE